MGPGSAPETSRHGLETHPVLASALIAVVNVLVSLTVVECGSRWLGHVQFPPDPLITDRNVAWVEKRLYDPLLFWRMRPLLSNEHGPVTNSLGLRGPEIPPEKGDEFRILSLGESTTYASRFPYAEGYSALVEAALPELEGRRVRVINAGIPGYTLFQGYVYLEHRGIAFQPDAVLLYFGFNDFLGVAFRVERDFRGREGTGGLTDRELFERRQGPAHRLVDWLYAHSNFARWVGAVVHRSMGRARAARSGAGPGGARRPVLLDPDHPRVPEADRLDLLRRFRDFCAARGIRLVIIVPWYRSFEGHAPLLRRFAGEHGIPLVDLPERLAELPAPRASYFEDVVHPTRAGHRLIADAIVEVLEASWGGDS